MTQYNKLIDTKKQVDTVVEIMRDNVDKVLQREQKLDDMETKTEELKDGSSRFVRVSTKLKHKMWCKNMKFVVILGVIFLILLMIILIIIFKK